jgi:acyl dehydratase
MRHDLALREAAKERRMTPQEVQAKVGENIGTSEWVEMSQERINQFAEATGDHQFIHIDPERAKMTPFGGTIAHGFLTLSMIPYLSAHCTPRSVRMNGW